MIICHVSRGSPVALEKRRRFLPYMVEEMRVRKSKQNGFSLIEVLIAMLLMSAVLISLIVVIAFGFNNISRTKQYALATHVAQEAIEYIRNQPFDQISFAGLGPTFMHESLIPLENGACYLTVQSGAGDDIKKVSIRVRWFYRGNEINKHVVTYITRDGINKK